MLRVEAEIVPADGVACERTTVFGPGRVRGAMLPRSGIARSENGQNHDQDHGYGACTLLPFVRVTVLVSPEAAGFRAMQRPRTPHDHDHAYDLRVPYP